MFLTSVLKIAAQTFEAGDFLQVFLRFWGFKDWFSHKTRVRFQSDCLQIRIWNTVSTKMETLICELLKKELYITYSRGSRPTSNACILCVHIKHADDPEKNSIFIHRLLFCSKPVHKIILLPLSRSIPNGTSNSWHKHQIFTIFLFLGLKLYTKF